MRGCFVGSFVLLCLAMGGVCGAQTAEKPKEPSAFEQLFPQPTGLNGYEDIVAAGELSKQSQTLTAAMDPGATLTLKRRALAEPVVQRAITLLRTGLAKQIVSPRFGKPLDDTTLLPDLALMRNLARMLFVEQYVLLADGRVSAAIDSVRDGLRLGYIVQTDSLINGLVGIAIETIAATSLIRHLEQFSVRDCDRLLALVKEWLAAPSPISTVMEAEHRGMLTILKKYRSDSKGMLKLIHQEPATGQPDEISEVEQFIQENPDNLGALIDQTAALANQQFTSIEENLRLPPWERKPLPTGDPKSLAAKLFGQVSANYELIFDRYDRSRAQMHLLGVHTAIRRYKWEYGRLPDTLEQLKIGLLANDPFTGKPLVYERKGETYELYSAGPLDRSSDDRSPTGQRVPVYLPYRAK